MGSTTCAATSGSGVRPKAAPVAASSRVGHGRARLIERRRRRSTMRLSRCVMTTQGSAVSLLRKVSTRPDRRKPRLPGLSAALFGRAGLPLGTLCAPGLEIDPDYLTCVDAVTLERAPRL